MFLGSANLEMYHRQEATEDLLPENQPAISSEIYQASPMQQNSPYANNNASKSESFLVTTHIHIG